MLGKNTILKAIHNNEDQLNAIKKVWMLGKNTILKAIHNTFVDPACVAGGVNAG